MSLSNTISRFRIIAASAQYPNEDRKRAARMVANFDKVDTLGSSVADMSQADRLKLAHEVIALRSKVDKELEDAKKLPVGKGNDDAPTRDEIKLALEAVLDDPAATDEEKETCKKLLDMMAVDDAAARLSPGEKSLLARSDPRRVLGTQGAATTRGSATTMPMHCTAQEARARVAELERNGGGR